MAKDNRKITDPKGVLLGGKRYPVGTPLSEVEGATNAHIRIWTRFGQLSKAAEPEGEESAEGADKQKGSRK